MSTPEVWNDLRLLFNQANSLWFNFNRHICNILNSKIGNTYAHPGSFYTGITPTKMQLSMTNKNLWYHLSRLSGLQWCFLPLCIWSFGIYWIFVISILNITFTVSYDSGKIKSRTPPVRRSLSGIVRPATGVFGTLTTSRSPMASFGVKFIQKWPKLSP